MTVTRHDEEDTMSDPTVPFENPPLDPPIENPNVDPAIDPAGMGAETGEVPPELDDDAEE